MITLDKALMLTRDYKFECCGERVEDDIHELLQELKERRESELRATKHYKTATTNKQFLHVRSELSEIEDAKRAIDYPHMGRNLPECREHLAEEIADCQMSLETYARCCEFSEEEMREARKKVIEKNRIRGYYEVSK